MSRLLPVHSYGSIQNVDDVNALPKSTQSPVRQPRYGTCAQLKAFRFNDDALEAQFVREQYRTPCFMRMATVFGVVQIIIAPSLLYNPKLWASPVFYSSLIFKLSIIYTTLSFTGGLLLTLFSRLPQTHRWWTAIGTSSSILIFFGYFLFLFIAFVIFPSPNFYFDTNGEVTPCNHSMFASSNKFLTDALAGSGTPSGGVKW